MLDQNRPFIPVRFAILTVSDTRVEADDVSGQKLYDFISSAGHEVVERTIVKDDQALLSKQIENWLENNEIQAIISTGGTGLTGRDITPEVFEKFFDKPIDGFGEIFRMLSYQKIGTSTIQSRAVAGVAKGTYMFALPGSPSACVDAWEGILKFQFNNQFRPCNLVEIMPRLGEVGEKRVASA